jgi:hypothetical protein
MWVCSDRSSRPPKAPPRRPGWTRSWSSASARQAVRWRRSTCVEAAAAVGHGEAGLVAERGGVLRRGLVRALDDDLAARLRVAPADRHVAVDLAAPQRLLDVGERLELVDLDDDRSGGAARRLRVVGCHDRDRLAPVAHDALGEHRLVGDVLPLVAVPRHVVDGQHRVHPAHGQCRRDVEARDAPVRHVAAPGRPPQHPLGGHVAEEVERPGDLRHGVGARDGLADAAAHRRAAHLDAGRGGARRGQRSRAHGASSVRVRTARRIEP